MGRSARPSALCINGHHMCIQRKSYHEVALVPTISARPAALTVPTSVQVGISARTSSAPGIRTYSFLCPLGPALLVPILLRLRQQRRPHVRRRLEAQEIHERGCIERALIEWL